MKKWLKVLLIVIIIAFLLGGTVGGLVGFADRINDESEPRAALKTWMAHVEDETLLKNVVLPGAHDAATAGMLWVSETQSRTVSDLLACGVRYFDLRVRSKNGKLVIFHGPVNGVDAEEVMDTFKAFVTENPTEIILADFQHFDKAQEKVVEKAEKDWLDIMVVNDSEADDVTFMDELTVGAARGKIVTFIGEDDGTQSAKPCFFRRSDDLGVPADSPIRSLYYGSAHKGDYKKFIEKTLPEYVAKYKEDPHGIFVLQCQLTDGALFLGPKFRESQQEKEMNEYVANLKNIPDFSLINVVMRDYLSPAKCETIIRLNKDKGIVKASFGEIFS